MQANAKKKRKPVKVSTKFLNICFILSSLFLFVPTESHTSAPRFFTYLANTMPSFKAYQLFRMLLKQQPVLFILRALFWCMPCTTKPPLVKKKSRKRLTMELKPVAKELYLDLSSHYERLVTFIRDIYCRYNVERKLSRDTFFLAIGIFTKACTSPLDNNHSINLKTVESYTKAALSLASKYEDVYPLAYSHIQDISDDNTSITELIQIEQLVLKTLDFRLTSIRTAEHYRNAAVVICKQVGVGAFVDSDSATLLDVIIQAYNVACVFNHGVTGVAVVFYVLSPEEQRIFIAALAFMPKQLHECIDAIKQYLTEQRQAKKIKNNNNKISTKNDELVKLTCGYELD